MIGHILRKLTGYDPRPAVSSDAGRALQSVSFGPQKTASRFDGVTQGDLDGQAARANQGRLRGADCVHGGRSCETCAWTRGFPIELPLAPGDASSAAAHERETRAPYLRPGLLYDGGDW